MTRLLTATLTLTLLAACGADGPPVAPTRAEAAPAKVTLGVSGDAHFGIEKRLD